MSEHASPYNSYLAVTVSLHRATPIASQVQHADNGANRPFRTCAHVLSIMEPGIVFLRAASLLAGWGGGGGGRPLILGLLLFRIKTNLCWVSWLSILCKRGFRAETIVQELCESRAGRHGLSVQTSLLVSIDVKLY